ncbi:serine/threonine protein kinase [Anabaenopsis tanganyikae CS-531]|uniref:non-specific serine/threonine protein kinase n=1 Tax=Anabaenopsis tanganyikae CS-531 TaxID=2785304 RepID=A0ABT6K9A3_9CYAN|nr:serine/threonine-protein kinase [Anabaenopsis tanganyikae]MDH6104333.1 serine/threonine protein kinase [Anabaenopsis tanganyikae CS-531]
MKIHCTRPGCLKPENHVTDTTTPELVCEACGMPLILLNNYLPVEPLGTGGFGSTFKAIYLPLHNQGVTTYRVIKRLNIQTHDPKLVEGIQLAFQREAKILLTLGENANIPVLYDYFSFTAPAFESQGQLYPQQELQYLAQQYIAGQDLNQELQKQGRFSEEKIKELLLKILPVLQFIHQNHAIHRDIKPSNIICEGEKLFLIDFGAVKQVVEGKTDLQTSLVFGSRVYAPPEQIAGKEVDPSSDLYALAASCIQLLTRDSLEYIRNNDNRWNWRTKYPGIVSNHLADILDRMLQPNPKRRYQSAEDVIKALSETLRPNFFTLLINYIKGSKRPIPLILLITVISLLSIGVVKVFSPSLSIRTISFEDPTSKIKIQYPQNWQPQPANTTDTIVRISPINVSQTGLPPEFILSVEHLAPDETLEDYREFAIKNRIHQNIQPETIKVADRDAYRVLYMRQNDKNNFGFKVMEIWIMGDQKVYVLTYSAEEKDYDKFLKPVEETMINSVQLPQENQELWRVIGK